MRIRSNGWDRYSSFPDFFSDHVLYNPSSFSGTHKRGIEEQSEKLAELFGALVETLVICNVINVDDIDRIIGSYYKEVEIEDED